ncbi:hypothetical protein IFR05_006955 [Cadophora sp. M221]|nr:hypothetical protein IFR05_006955 [Cadophora sp. M221]
MPNFDTLRMFFSRSKTVHVPDCYVPEADGDEKLPAYSESNFQSQDISDNKIKFQEIDNKSPAIDSPQVMFNGKEAMGPTICHSNLEGYTSYPGSDFPCQCGNSPEIFKCTRQKTGETSHREIVTFRQEARRGLTIDVSGGLHTDDRKMAFEGVQARTWKLASY